MECLKCILVAEDEQDDMFFLRRAFEKAGLSHKLVHVNDGMMAVAYLLGDPPFSNRVEFPLPDLLLLDLKMPKMDGFEVLAMIRSEATLQDIPVVVLSSSALAVDMATAKKLGASEYVVKPSSPDELRKLVLQLEERWLSNPVQKVELASAVTASM